MSRRATERDLAGLQRRRGNYLAGTVWPPVVQYLIENVGWRNTHLIIGAVCLVTILPLTLVLRRRPPHVVHAHAAVQAARPPRDLGISPNALQAILVVAGLAGCATQMGPDGRMVLKLPSEAVSDTWAAKGYVGPRACLSCHERLYSDYRDHGHPKKLRPASEAREWGVPLPDGYTWDDISYVIGGATRKARYIDQQGFRTRPSSGSRK